MLSHRMTGLARLWVPVLFSLIQVKAHSQNVDSRLQNVDTILRFQEPEVQLQKIFDTLIGRNIGVTWVPGYPDASQTIRLPNPCTADHALRLIVQKYDLNLSFIDSATRKDYNIVRKSYIFKVSVTESSGIPLPLANIYNMATQKTVKTDLDGNITLDLDHRGQSIVVSFAGMEPDTLSLTTTGYVTVRLRVKIASMAETIVRTGYEYGKPIILIPANRSVLSGTALSITSNNNPLGILTGQDAGSLATSTSGNSTSVLNILIHGQNSIFNSREPLLIVDNVILAAGNQSISNLPSGISAGSQSVLSYLDPSSIERIEILKDAEATAIYGARGANGVIIITTKRAKASGKPRWAFQLTTGIGHTTNLIPLMDSKDYVALMTEAYKNDNIPIDPNNPPSFKAWGTSSANNWQKFIMNDASHTYRFLSSVVGGNTAFSYYAGVSGTQESSPYPTHPTHRRLNSITNLHYHSDNNKLDITLHGLLGWDRNQQFMWLDPSMLQLLTPNVPITPNALKDAQGHMVTMIGSSYFLNPYYFLNQPATSNGHNHLLNAFLTWDFYKYLTARVNIGVNESLSKEIGLSPIDPTLAPIGSSYFARTLYRSTILEPQLSFNKNYGRWVVNLLSGATIQNHISDISSLSATGYSNNDSLSNPAFATDTSQEKLHMDFTYKSLFGRLSILLDSTYILNFSYRKEGSDRLYPTTYYGDFYSVGAAWIFTTNTFMRSIIHSMSLGRIRASYGVTGNDQMTNTFRTPGATSVIGSWVNQSSYTKPGINLDSKKDPWEKIDKLEFGLDLGLSDNKFQFGLVWYQNNSVNQLIPTGRLSTNTQVTFKSWRAEVLNQGWDIQFTSRNIDHKGFSWTTKFNWSFPSTRLISFPGLSQTILANDLKEGESLNVFRGYRYQGVDPTSGVFKFADLNHDGKITEADQTLVGRQDVTSFGGMTNIFRYKKLQLEFLIDARISTGINYIGTLFLIAPPGSANNQYNNTVIDLNDRWRAPGDQAKYQRASTGLLMNSAADTAAQAYGQSDALFENSSFIRLRRVCFSWLISPASTKEGKRHTEYSVYIIGQNLLTLSPYKGPSPELQSATAQPLMRTVELGLTVKI
ncbi:MAG: SusC/RagA family TonB-linked outer membrane protein [Bacteroidetes bacterium]|nr:SusC/RagA family TonB-linked outer membrane protein [Bacteroidota bacterium]